MKCAIILLACLAAVHCYYYKPKRPDFNCDYYCKHRGVDPKCSEKGQTYQNDCYLECAWAYKECDGVCPCLVKVQKEAYCICAKEYKPVCAYDGNTYDNKCIADCKNKPIMHNGPCPEW